MSLAHTLWRRPLRSELDTRRAQRVEQVLTLVEQFVYDLGLLIAGEEVDLTGYVDAACAGRLHAALQPALHVGTRTRPDFGEYAQVRIAGDLLDLAQPVRAVVEFDDRSTQLDQNGFAVAHSRRRMRLELMFDSGLSRVLDHRIEVVT